MITRILETALYVDDVPAVVAFYRDVLGLRAMEEGDRLVPMDAGQGTVLLVFKRGATLDGLNFPGGRIPPHDGHGPAHLAFAITEQSLPDWERRLAASGVDIESRVRWPRGGQSIYFRDAAGHSVELATPGVWPVY